MDIDVPGLPDGVRIELTPPSKQLVVYTPKGPIQGTRCKSFRAAIKLAWKECGERSLKQ